MLVRTEYTPNLMKYIKRDFPKYDVMLREKLKERIRENVFNAYWFYCEGKQVGYCVLATKNTDCLIIYIGIHPEYRNKGYGSTFLKQIRNFYKGVIFAEILPPYSPQNKRRYNFYLRNKYKLINSKYISFQYNRYLMANKKDKSYKNKLRKIYHTILGVRYQLSIHF